MDELIERRLFPSAPVDDLVARFHRHLAETGQPETFPSISTSRPPRDGHVVALFHPVDINRNKRALNDRAPCPICSPRSPKYLSGGTLIWCENTQAIYAVGPDCSSSLWEDGRLNRALNLLTQSEREKSNSQKLKRIIQAIPLLRNWNCVHREAATKASILHSDAAKNAPQWRGALSRRLKSPFADDPVLAGQGFLRGSWKLTAKIEEAEQTLEDLLAEAGTAPDEWVSNLAPKAVVDRLRDFEKAQSAMRHVAERLNEAAAFLENSNLQLLGQWGKSGGAPVDFSAIRTATTVEIRASAEHWRGRLELSRPTEPPLVV